VLATKIGRTTCSALHQGRRIGLWRQRRQDRDDAELINNIARPTALLVLAGVGERTREGNDSITR
jgi:hypothetical protein